MIQKTVQIEHLNIGGSDGTPINALVTVFNNNNEINELLNYLTYYMTLSFEYLKSRDDYSFAKYLTLGNGEKK